MHLSKNKSEILGNRGEGEVAALLATLPEDKYVVLNNIMLANAKGTTQIDHIVLSVYGIFIIETKNFRGTIYGTEKSEYWTQYINNTKHDFESPIRQNYVHFRTMEDWLYLDKGIRIIPLIAFSNQCVLKVQMKHYPVVYFSQIIGFIRQFNQEVIGFQRLLEIRDYILRYNIIHSGLRQQHVAVIKRTKAEKDYKIANSICPKCGGLLVNRNGRNGIFIGCSNYPRCRYILNNR